MPITYAPPQPVAPSLSAAGGAAEVMTKDFPTLASMYEHMASLRAQAGAQQQANAGLQQQSRQFAESMANQQAQFGAGIDVRSGMQAMEGQQAAAQIDQKAQVAAWLNQQELSQKEQMQLVQKKNAIGDIMANSNLTDDEKSNLVFKIKTGIDMDEQRNQKAQTDALNEQREQHAALFKAQAEMLKQKKDYDAAAAKNQFTYKVNPDAEAGITEEVSDAMSLPPTHPDVKARVQQVAQDRGLALRYWQNSKGEMMPDKDWNKMVTDRHSAQIEARKDRLTQLSHEQHSKMFKDAQAHVDSMAKADKDHPENWTPEKRSAAVKQYMDDATADWQKRQADQQPGPKPFGPKDKLDAMKRIDQQISEVDSRVGLPAMQGGISREHGTAVIRSLLRIKDLTHKYGPTDYMKVHHPEVYKTVDQLLQNVETLPHVAPPSAGTTRAGSAAGGIGARLGAAAGPAALQ